MFHSECLDTYASSLPAHTAKAGFVCPECKVIQFNQFRYLYPFTCFLFWRNQYFLLMKKTCYLNNFLNICNLHHGPLDLFKTDNQQIMWLQTKLQKLQNLNLHKPKESKLTTKSTKLKHKQNFFGEIVTKKTLKKKKQSSN